MASATDVRELSVLSGVYYLTLCSRHLTQPAFIKASLGASSSPLKVAGPPTEVQNTDPAHLFVLITMFSKRCKSVSSIYVSRPNGTIHQSLSNFKRTI